MANKDYTVRLEVELMIRADSENSAYRRAERLQTNGWLKLQPDRKTRWLSDLEDITIIRVEQF